MKYDELIKEMKKFSLSDNDGCLECAIRTEISINGYCNSCIADLLNEASNAIEELQAQLPKWIPAAERLPEEDSEVLIFTERRDVIYGTFADGMFSDDWQYYTPDYVVCWMYIPEPPKEGS